MSKQLIQSVKGTRDFYPEDMAFRNWLYSKMRKASELYGYQEYDGPEIEYLDLYAGKTSEEILKEQAFTLKDRDDRTLMLRPELTPTFARMVAQKSQQLLKPIRWWMIGRAWRYEKPQRGRGREFFQWEVNILGPETPEADAEVLAVIGTFFKEVGLTTDEVVVRVNDRSYFEQIIKENGIDTEKYLPLLRIIDRKEKISGDEFNNLLAEEGLSGEQIEGLNRYFDDKDFSKAPWLSKVFESLEKYGDISKYFVYDPIIARGLDYYTRTVFEAWDKTGNLKRAIFGGGRFDNLTATIGGDRVPGVGYAVGDMGITEVLQQFGKVPVLTPSTATVLVSVFNPEMMGESLKISASLRAAGVSCECWTDGDTKLEKQLKYADQKGIKYIVIAGPDEFSRGEVFVKNLAERSQENISIEKLSEFFRSKN
jgi:histidyl-tRNA synthetase